MKGGSVSSSKGFIPQGYRDMCLFYLSVHLQKLGQNHVKNKHLINIC